MSNRSAFLRVLALALCTIFLVIGNIYFPPQAAGAELVKIAVPTGFPAISMAELISKKTIIRNSTETEYEVVKSPDLMAGRLISGEADIAIVPTNLAIKLYNKGIDLKLAGSVVWGILYLVTSGDFKTWEDLKGQEIYMLGRGLTPDIVFRYLLKANGLNPDTDVKLKYVQNTSELAPSFITGKSKISIMPEPALSMVLTKKKGAKVMLDLQKEWASISGNAMSYPQASLVIKKGLISRDPDYVDAFLKQFESSLNRIKADHKTAGEMAGSFLDTPSPKIITKAMPRGNLEWVPGQKARKAIEEYLSVLMNFSPESIGGKLPDDGFYM